MAIQLMRLRGVPDDELTEVHELLDKHEIEYYETTAGNWGISMPALWLRDDDEYPRARALLDEYQRERYLRVRAEYEALKQAGKARTLKDIVQENPVRFILYSALIAGLAYISIAPFTGRL